MTMNTMNLYTASNIFGNVLALNEGLNTGAEIAD